MIFNAAEEKEVISVGDIKNNNVSIDTNNIDFIVTLLSTSLYSKPIESFIRETVSNAWDSHVESNSDEPVLLELGEDTEGNKFCRIQDFGVGLSPERFDSIYRNIGSSTKRADKNQIGGFGIGRFSALAYSNMVHITSVFDGEKYLYMMYKDGNSVSIDLLNSAPTTERNGLEVKVNLKSGDYSSFVRAIKSQLVYFENLYIVDTTYKMSYEEDIAKLYNNFSIKKYNNFWVNNFDRSKEINLVLGKVRYPLRLSSLSKPYPSYVGNYPISLVFNIGELEITPNREELLYSKKSVALIEERLDLAVEEIKDLIEAQRTEDFTNIESFLTNLEARAEIKLLENDVRISIPKGQQKLTLNGVYYHPESFRYMYQRFMSLQNVVSSNYRLRSSQIQYSVDDLSISTIKDRFSKIFLCDVPSLNTMSKRYIRETFPDESLFIKPGVPIKNYVRSYIDTIKESIERVNRNNYDNSKKIQYDHRIFKVLFHSVYRNIVKLQTFHDGRVPNSWIQQTKADDKDRRALLKKDGVDWKQNINLFSLRAAHFGSGVTSDSKVYSLGELSKKFKMLTVYDAKDSTKLRRLYSYFQTDTPIRLVEAAPTKLKLLEDVKNFVKYEDFMSTKYAKIRNIGTVEYLRREMPHLEELARINNIGSISEKLALTVQTLMEFVKKHRANEVFNMTRDQPLIDEIYDICENDNYFNESIKGLFLENKKELMNAQVLISLSEKAQGYSSARKIPAERINMTVDYLLKRRLIIPSIQAVKKVKQETIFNIKIEENEDNQD